MVKSGSGSSISSTVNISISDEHFKLNNDISRYNTKSVTNPTGADDVIVTMTPSRWAMLKVNLQIAKKTLTYDPTYKVWLKPKLVDSNGT